MKIGLTVASPSLWALLGCAFATLMPRAIPSTCPPHDLTVAHQFDFGRASSRIEWRAVSSKDPSTQTNRFLERKSLWLVRPLGLEKVRAQAELMEAESKRFYQTAARHSTDATIRQLLGDLAAAERRHEARAEELLAEYVPAEVEKKEGAAERRLFLLQIVQPGLAGLMDGSVSTLAPLFAAAFATKDSWQTLLVGLAVAFGAGISMGFAEALSDNGSLTGRGSPLLRGAVCGLMTAVGGLGHSLPFLIPDFYTATAIAVALVAVELAVIAWVRNRYMDTPLLSAAFQVMVGGLLVFGTGILIGSS